MSRLIEGKLWYKVAGLLPTATPDSRHDARDSARRDAFYERFISLSFQVTTVIASSSQHFPRLQVSYSRERLLSSLV